ncbi:flavodoxin family protein [Micromonospora sp. NPDC003776]
MSSSSAAGPRSYLFLLGSARHGGNTETLARHAATRLPVDARVRWLRLAELPLPRFEDVRHRGSGRYPEPVGNARVLLDATLTATDVVIASPLYWYTVSADVKTYLDHWSGWMRVPGVDFRARMRGKTLWAVSTVSDEDRTTADPMLGTLRLTADYLGMRWGGALVGYGNRPGDVLADAAALARAETFFAGQPAAVA